MRGCKNLLYFSVMAEKKKEKTVKKTKKVTILKGTAGRFKMGYLEGDTAELEIKQADELIKLGYAK